MHRRSHPDPEAVIAAVATPQLGLATGVQLVAGGLGRAAVGRMAQRGRLRRLHHDVYLCGPVPVSPEMELLAACLALGGVVGGPAAAYLHGIWPGERPPPEVVTRTRCDHHLEGVVARRTNRLDPEDTTIVGALSCLSPPRTLLALAWLVHRGQLHPAKLRWIFTRAWQKGLVTPRGMIAYLDRKGARGWQGAAYLRALAAERLGRPRFGDSVGEVGVFDLLVSVGVAPEDIACGHKIRDGTGEVVAEADIALVWAFLDIERDGEGHFNEAQAVADRERDARLAALGWLTLRVTRATMANPEAFLAALRRRLADFAHRRPSRPGAA